MCSDGRCGMKIYDTCVPLYVLFLLVLTAKILKRKYVKYAHMHIVLDVLLPIFCTSSEIFIKTLFLGSQSTKDRQDKTENMVLVSSTILCCLGARDMFRY